MNQTELCDLPEEAEKAFPLFEQRLREKYLDGSFNEPSFDDRREYAIGLIAFYSAYEVEMNLDLDALLSSDSDDFFPAFHALEAKARIMSFQYILRINRKNKAGISAVYLLDPSQKSTIHEQLNIIREIIANADISIQKRDALVKRLNAFAEEVDRDRTHGEAFMSFYVASKREIKDIADLTDHIEKILWLLSKAKEFVEALPGPKALKQLTGPKRPSMSETSPDLDDEIPF